MTEVTICYGNASPTDLHLLSKVHCVDEEIISWLERREQRRRVVEARRQAGDLKHAHRL
jgi:hypothetical protein